MSAIWVPRIPALQRDKLIFSVKYDVQLYHMVNPNKMKCVIAVETVQIQLDWLGDADRFHVAFVCRRSWR